MSLPIIDITCAHATRAEDKRAVARDVDQVCRETGIFGITGHGLSRAFLDDFYGSVRAFFALPQADKARYQVDRIAASSYADACPYGYVALEAENQSAFMGRQGPDDLMERLSAGPAILDPASDLPLPSDAQVPGLRRHIEAFYRACKQTSTTVGELFALAVGLPLDFFTSRMTRAHDALRINAYPSVSSQAHDLGLAAHTDATLFTLVSQDLDGLMIRAPGGDWQPVCVPAPDILMVNIGDLMMRWTNDEWISTEHRVLLGSRPRLSTTYFKVVDQHISVEVLPQFCTPDKPARYEPIDFSRFITDKLNRLFQVS